MHRLTFVATGLLFAGLATLTFSAGHTLAAAPKCNGLTATNFAPAPLTGTGGDDILVGSNGDDTINGLGGHDLICARGGDDTINPGPGDDTVYSGDDDDSMADGAANNGNDSYYGDRGNDAIYDLVVVGANIAYGGPGSDGIKVTGKAYGESGDDPVVAAQETSPGAHDAYASGGSGSDGATTGVYVAGGIADGGSGNDFVSALSSGDKLVGGSGSDVLESIGPNHTLDCGSAFDTYTADAADSVLPNCEQAAP